MILTFLFGGLISVSYIFSEIVAIANRESMEGYFNALGMIWVILSLTIILTIIPSFICQIRIMIFQKKMLATDNIDEDYSNKKNLALKLFPAKFLRNCNLVFSFTIVAYFSYALILTLIEQENSSIGFIFVLVLSLVMLLCGVVLSIDGLKLIREAGEQAISDDE